VVAVTSGEPYADNCTLLQTDNHASTTSVQITILKKCKKRKYGFWKHGREDNIPVILCQPGGLLCLQCMQLPLAFSDNFIPFWFY